MRIGISELIVIFIITVALFKPDKLEDYASKSGKLFKKFIDETKDVNNSIKEVKEELEEVIEPVASLKEDIKEDIDKISK